MKRMNGRVLVTVVAVCLLLTAALPSAAAGDPAAVDAAIEAIGTVSYRDSVRTAIEQAEAAYAALSADEQAQVQNAAALSAARRRYDGLAAIAEDLSVVWQMDVSSEEGVLNDGSDFALESLGGDGRYPDEHWTIRPNAAAWSMWGPMDVDISALDFDSLHLVVSLRRTGGADSWVEYDVRNADGQRLLLNCWYNDAGMADGEWGSVDFPFTLFEDGLSGQVPWPQWTADTWHRDSPLSLFRLAQPSNPAESIEIGRLAILNTGADIPALVDAANAVNDQIDAIGAVTAADQEGAVTAARAAYDALSPVQQQLVVNEPALQQAEKTLRQVKAAGSVINAIAAIGEVTADNYRDKADPIAAAQELYDNFVEKYAAPDAVTNADVLRAAKEAYDGFVAAEHPAVTFGDINGDGAVNAADALLALQHSVKLITLEGDKITAADVSGDGAVNAADALLILQKSVKLIDLFPAEQAS